ncbi:hypothetical protein V565_130150 [Rhizoctonia solani 123E]|uniref:LYC1 C-terminal domain-containing protein n=1 Tax=Rhizoctonia solani 123E TaxID=1423351 RepID=A0A074RUF6_9AGAM|nr:hypothetical protein V565_130150 [Rhizoctonia solani 123E]
MSQSNTELQNYTISQATREQRSQILIHVNDHWGTPETGLEYLIRYHSTIESKNYAKDGRLTYWVFVPKDAKDTLDILSCCRTYRRDASILHANSDIPTQAFGYAIGTVVTPKQHRGRGYANRMLTLLHHALAPNVYSTPGVEIDIPPAVYPGAFSVLYSDIGTYYERCGPSPGEIGWKVQNPIHTIWQLSETLPVLAGQTDLLSKVQLLSQEEVTTLLSSDVPDWESLPRAPDTTYVAFSPSALPNTHLITRSIIHPSHNTSTDVFWGARMSSKGHFITWAFDYYTPRTLVITRIHADSTTLPVLLLAAFQAGETQGCQQAEVWNLPEELMDEANRLRGTTQARNSHLPAIRWYGPEPAKSIVWIRNEYYAWT